MTELSILIFFLSIAFILAPLMTNKFFLRDSKVYSRAHGVSLLVLLFGFVCGFNWIAITWLLFCIFGFLLYLKQEGRFLFSLKGFATCIPFVFSLISATWFVAGSNNLHLLGYNTNWSFYAALHASILGWFFIGCLAYLAKRPNANNVYLFGCYLCLFLFLSVAFGINGIPYIKHIGVIGFSILVPFSIGLFAFDLKKENRLSWIFAVVSLLSIILSMTIAVLNEFWLEFPKRISGIPLMTLTHGFLNTLFTVPLFYLAIQLESEDQFCQTAIANESVIFFDGFCVLCNGTVSQLLKMDKKRILRYSSLQGEYANKVLDSSYTQSGASVVYMSGKHLYVKAEAVIHILMILGGVYKLLAMFLNLFPLFILNQLYDFVARNRYRFFGKRDTCLIPNSEDKDLFIS
jgi:predicted DCC family thiol-disulfide oxidoreductase YuxK